MKKKGDGNKRGEKERIVRGMNKEEEERKWKDMEEKMMEGNYLNFFSGGAREEEEKIKVRRKGRKTGEGKYFMLSSFLPDIAFFNGNNIGGRGKEGRREEREREELKEGKM